MASVKKLAVLGAVWTIIGFGASQILRFGSNLVLTRLLVPEFFGLMAIVNVLRMGIELFSDIGISPSIINNKKGDEPAFRNTAWTIQLIRGMIIWLFALLVTQPIANFYQDERLLWLIPIVGFSSVVDGFSSTNIYTCQRRLDLARFTVFDFIVQTLSVATYILLAWLSPTIWSLALGTLAGAMYRTIGSHWLIPDVTNRFAWNRDAVRDILSFGKWMFVSSALIFMAEQSDRLILGKLLNFETLGVYTIAYTLANIPKEIIKKLSYIK